MEIARPSDPLISIVVPVLNEEDCVRELAGRTVAALEGYRYELVFVDDGSRDRTLERIRNLRAQDPCVRCIRLTRPFGHQAALAAGLERARGDVVITMDGDLQHPPEMLPELLAAWRAGADVVHTERRETAGSSGRLKRLSSRFFYWLMKNLTAVPVVAAGADFRALDRRVVDRVNDLEERFVFLRGLVPWLGFDATSVPYDAAPRFSGASKYDTWRMIRLALDGLFSFSILPLRLITILGIAVTTAGVLYGCFTLWSYFAGRLTGPPGWSSLMLVILIFGGVQLLALGIASEYLGRIYEEVKRRPRYIVDSTLDEAE